MGSLRENISEDDLAFLRDAADFKNLLLVEQPNGDWAQTILRQFLFSAYQYQYYQQLQHSANQQLAAIAEKSLKETTYHLRWSSDWVLRLGDGTEESHQRISKAIEALYMFTGEMFQNAAYETALLVDKVSVDLTLLQQPWMQKVSAVFEEATLQIPSKTFVQQGGKTGIHSEHLGFILSEMQYLQRAYPNSNW